MRRAPRIDLLFVLLFAVLAAEATGDSLSGKTVALVSWIAGPTTLRAAADAPPETLALFARLAPGAVLETSPGATVTVVFFDGQRQTVAGSSRVVVRPTTLYAEVGHVKRLAPLPVIVDLAPLLRNGSPGWKTPATPLRGGGGNAVARLHPRDGAPVRRGAAILSFDVDPAVQVYRVVVEDEEGHAIFRADPVLVPPVRVPLGLLRPGKLYHWSVEPQVPPHPELRGEAMFLTLSERQERARESLAEAARRSSDPDLAQLLAEVDRDLGLTEPLP
jgi:hypothetical protein